MILHDIPREKIEDIPQGMLAAMYGLWKRLELYAFKVDLSEESLYVMEGTNWTYLGNKNGGYGYWTRTGVQYGDPIKRLPEWRIIFDHSIPSATHLVTLVEAALTR